MDVVTAVDVLWGVKVISRRNLAGKWKDWQITRTTMCI